MPPKLITLTLPADEQWTLHHVLLDRIEEEITAHEMDLVDPPLLNLVQAFETLDDGDLQFTVAQLRAIRDVLAEYHHSTTWWEIDRPRIERLLDRITNSLENNQAVRT